eukprot:CAMPEP_0194709276 /NCGR_PEP_ID=MMETSP0296-20130528/2073_1 /TAXON_ID=39354 /ORGANISM="Heterosigma akashiwo, Strain CCMP2393" /LENGTH=108 /DNA_ID=CAMNT_0039606475 /DNA_START=41 /DNA_END=367 /DNA_ORIENTATION=-
MVRSSRSRTPASLLSMKTVLTIICCLLCVNALQYNQHAKGKLVRDGGKQECRAMPAQGPCTKNQEQAAAAAAAAVAADAPAGDSVSDKERLKAKFGAKKKKKKKAEDA